MLFSESRDPAYIKSLAAKQDVIDKLKSDLTKAGIKYDSLGSTKLAIYNKVTRATPIYTLVATNIGGFDIIDDSQARLKSTRKPEDADTLFANYNDRGTVTSLSKIQRTSTIGTGKNQRVVPNNSFESNYFEMPNGDTVAKKHYFTGVISVISSEDIRKADDGTVMYGHYKYSGEEKDLVLASVEILENGNATTYTAPKKRELKANPNAAREWFDMAAKYGEATTLTGDQLYQACLDYLLTTFDSTTVNAAVKGGKLKYVIEPAEKLQNALTAEYGDDVTSNLDDVENTNAENPIFVVKPCEGITLRIVMTRPAPGEKANKIVITNTDKTLLFNDIKANNAEINNPDYRGIKVATIITNSERDALSRKINFDLDVDDVIEAIDNYVSANQEALKTAIPKKAEAEANSAKYNARLAADREKLNIQRARDDKRAQKLADREAERIAKDYKPGTIKKAAETLWSSDEDYDNFLNSLVDL
jgi:hypothetical protein